MVKPFKKKVLAQLNEIERRLVTGAELDITVMRVDGQAARVGYGVGGLFITMTADKARCLAEGFDCEEARNVGADVIGRDLMDAADACDLHNAQEVGRQ